MTAPRQEAMMQTHNQANNTRPDQARLDQARLDYRRIEAAITYIAAHYRDAPSLDEVAAAAHLSPFHFQRLFTRWAGVSPKAFARYLGLDHARALLRRDGASCLDAALDAGLSGPGRLHDMFVRIEAMTPGEYGSGGAGLAIRYGFADSLFGEVIIAATPRGVCHLAFCDVGDGDDRGAALARLRATFPEAGISAVETGQQAMSAAAQAALAALDRDWSSPAEIRLHLRATPFQLKVWEALLRIPMGRLASYGDVAGAIGNPGAGRAVGTAIGANPVAWLIPCHRVIRQTGDAGGYMWGPARKRAIIGWESARCDMADSARDTAGARA
jgi:AraC family transcriptional regulator of adaptative response/methylated-DNA-[protein]-cysteine methyltransferase